MDDKPEVDESEDDESEDDESEDDLLADDRLAVCDPVGVTLADGESEVVGDVRRHHYRDAGDARLRRQVGLVLDVDRRHHDPGVDAQPLRRRHPGDRRDFHRHHRLVGHRRRLHVEDVALQLQTAIIDS